MKNKIVALLVTVLFCTIGNFSFAQTPLKTEPQMVNYKYSEIEEKRKGLWEEFHKIRFGYFGDFKEINLYAEDNSLTRVCFICDKGLFIFHWNKTDGTIQRVEHAKLIDYNKINRITYETTNRLSFFKLWYYEKEELRIGAN